MIYYSIAIAGITIVYLFIISFFIIGWEKIPVYQKGSSILSGTFLSLIIALRNEEKNVPNLITSLLNQSLVKSCFEIIIVDDHSSDNTYQLCTSLVFNHSNIKILKLSKNAGKKQALIFGIKESIGQLIVTTDADCVHHKDWLETILEFYQKFKPKMILAPVIMQSNNIFEKIQAIDFYSLIVSGAGSSGLHRPIMCNGSNLAFEKEIFEEFSDPYNQNMISGDDIFMLLKIKKIYTGQIQFIKSKEAIVNTKAEQTFKLFLNQRKRWASKSTAYRDKDIIITAFIVFFLNSSLVVNLFIGFLFHNFMIIFIAQLLLKSIVDFIFLSRTNQFIKYKKLMWYFILAQFFNLFFIPYVAIAGIMSSVSWKDRIYSN